MSKNMTERQKIQVYVLCFYVKEYNKKTGLLHEIAFAA